MPNAKYDQTSVIMSGDDWVSSGYIHAYLYEGATFDKAHKFLSEASAGATHKGVTEVQNRGVGPEGQALGTPVAFNATSKGGPFQVVLAWDKNEDDQQVIAFYDEGEDGGELALLNNGTFILRPEDYDPARGQGSWFLF